MARVSEREGDSAKEAGFADAADSNSRHSSGHAPFPAIRPLLSTMWNSQQSKLFFAWHFKHLMVLFRQKFAP